MTTKSKQPIVYVAREIYIYDRDCRCYKVANFVSKAYLMETNIKYNEDGSIDKQYFVDFNINPSIFAIDRKTHFHVQNGDNIEVSTVFRDYESCRKYVTGINNRLADGADIYNTPLSLYGQMHKIREMADVYGKSLEDEFILPEERNGLIQKLSNEDEFQN